MTVRSLTLRERLAKLPPFVCFYMSRVRNPSRTHDELRRELWNRQNRELRRKLKERGKAIPRRRMYRRMTVEEVAAQFPKELRWYVPKLAFLLSWDTVQVRDMLMFLDAVGIDVLRLSDLRERLFNQFMAKTALSHLTPREQRDFVGLWRKWKRKPHGTD